MAYKVFVAGEEALASDVNSLLMSQTVPRFANAAARAAGITAPVLNQLSMRDDRPGGTEYWNGSTWVDVSEVSYTQVTASTPITNLSAATSHLVVADVARTYDASPIMIEFFAPQVATGNVAGSAVLFELYDAATDLGFAAKVGGSSPMMQIATYWRRRLTPTAGSHTYRVGAWITSGSGSVDAGAGGAGALSPAFLRITRA